MIHLIFKKCFNFCDKRLHGIVHFKTFDLMYEGALKNILHT